MNKLDIKSSLANINGIITADNSNCGTKAIFQYQTHRNLLIMPIYNITPCCKLKNYDDDRVL